MALFAGMLSSRENYYNQTVWLAELVTLVKSLGVYEKMDDWGFSMDIHLVVPLSLVAWRYRHRALRQEAMRLLLASPRREGLWDSVFIGKVAQWLAQVEEEGLRSEEYVPHKSRQTQL